MNSRLLTRKILACFSMMLRKFFRNYPTTLRTLSFLVFCIGIVLASTFFWTTQREFFGEMHEPHHDPRTIHLKPNREYQQTFIAEGRSVTGVLLLADTTTPPALGIVNVSVSDREHSTSGATSTADIFPSGELYISFSPALNVQKNAVVTLKITSTSDVNLQYQIDGNKYKDGSLSLFVPSTSTIKPIASDLGFQVHYRSASADILHLSILSTTGIALTALVGWFIFSWLLSQPLPDNWRLTFFWEKADIWALLVVIIIVGTVYGTAFFPHISWWSTNGDYTKDVIYLRSSVEVLQARIFPSWQMNMCGGQPMLGNPEGNVLSFGTILAALLGPTIGMKIFLWLELLIAAAGAYILGRMFGLSPIAAMLPALIFTLSGFIPNRAQTATMFVAGAAAMPWMLITFIRSLYRPQWLIACAAVTVAAFFAGDTHVMIYTLIAIGVIGIVHAIYHRRFQPIVLLSALALLLLLIGSVKLLPTIEGQSHYNGKQYPPLVVLLTKRSLLDDIFLARAIDHPAPITEHGKWEGWNNIGLYTGILPLLLGFIGIFFAPKHARPALLAVMGTLFVLGEGTFYEYVLRPLNGEIRSLFRIPSRSLIVLVLVLGITGGYALHWSIRRWNMVGISMSLIVLTIITIDLGSFTLSALRSIEQIPPKNVAIQQSIALNAKSAQNTNTHSHPLHILDEHTIVGSTCPDFNNTPSFMKNAYEGPLVTSSSGNPLVARINPQHLRVIPVSVPSSLHVHLASSPMLRVAGGIPRFLSDGSFQILVPRTSREVDISYASSLALPGLIISLATLASGILLSISRRTTRKA